MANDPTRTKDLARIHLVAKQLGMDQDTYRAMLRGLTGKESAGDLDRRQRWQVLLELGRQLGGSAASKPADPGRPAPQGAAKDPMLRKIDAQLTSAKRTWAYAHAMAQRMFSRDRVEWCDPAQIHSIVAALEVDAKRRSRQ